MSVMTLIGYMLEASKTTIGLFFLTLLLGLPLGLLLAVGRISKHRIISWPIQMYNLVMRGTPLMLQLYIVYFGIPIATKALALDIKVDRFGAAVVTFALNYAAYFAEIYRSGIQSIPKGQYEAASVLGFSKWQTFSKIILPQVIKVILPPMSSEFMTLVKDTSLSSVIANQEILLFARDQMSSAGSLRPLVVAGGFYLVMNIIIERCFSVYEKKLNYYK